MLDLLEMMIDRIKSIEASLLVGGVLSWITLSLLVAGVAIGKGHTGWGFFVFSLLLSPLLGVLVAVSVPDQNRARLARLETMLAGRDSPAGEAPPSAGETASASDRGARLVWTAIGIIVVGVLAVIGGVSQLGSSANTTFTTISDSLGEP